MIFPLPSRERVAASRPGEGPSDRQHPSRAPLVPVWPNSEDPLAAAYAFGLARNHPFVDGNKRTAAVVSEAFLLLGGYALGASDAEVVVAFVALAAGVAAKGSNDRRSLDGSEGELEEAELMAWFGERVREG